MPRTYDPTKWTVDEETGVYTRILQPPTEPNENYYKDITTTGAAADLAAELGLDLSEIEGTGLHGKVTKADVEKAAANR